jgi:myo-inositol 2-dehydrogenase/D-chiro-inositol 1-dehydrogenase
MAEPLRYGVIGTGLMGVEHLRHLALLDGAEAVAFADPHAPSRERAAGVAPEAEAYEDYRAMVQRDDLDALVVATPNHTHIEVVRDLLDLPRSGSRPLHLLIEKPLATTVEDARELAEALEGYNGVAWVGMEYRYMPPVRRLVEELRAGVIGRLRMLAIREHRRPFLPKVGDWNRFNRNTGGTLVEKCCHFFDLMRHITEREPVRLYASGGQDVNHLDERYGGERPDILDNAYVVVDFEDGTRALLDLCMFAEQSQHQEEIAATGDGGKIEAFAPASTVVVARRDPDSQARDPSRVETHEEHPDDLAAQARGHFGSTMGQHRSFLAAIREGTAAEVTPRDGLMAVAMGIAAHRSIDERRPVEMAEVLG